MAEERNTRREILRKLLTLGPVAALAAAFGGNGAKPAEAATYNENVIINSPYKLGIGKPVPEYSLDVVGDGAFTGGVTFSGPILANGAVQHSAASLFNVYASSPGQSLDIQANMGYVYFGRYRDNATLFSVTDNEGNVFVSGKVGIGVIPPNAKLDVGGSIQLTGNVDLVDGLVHHSGASDFAVYSSSYGYSLTLQANRGAVRVGKFEDNATLFSVRDVDGQAYFAGNVGIGVPTPAAKLDVAGDICITGTLQGTAQSARYDL